MYDVMSILLAIGMWWPIVTRTEKSNSFYREMICTVMWWSPVKCHFFSLFSFCCSVFCVGYAKRNVNIRIDFRRPITFDGRVWEWKGDIGFQMHLTRDFSLNKINVTCYCVWCLLNTLFVYVIYDIVAWRKDWKIFFCLSPFSLLYVLSVSESTIVGE